MTVVESLDYRSLNAMLNLYGPAGELQLDKDKEALADYLDRHVTPRLRTFPSPAAQLDFMVREGYYEAEVVQQYQPGFAAELLQRAQTRGCQFGSFLGALKFFTSYGLTTMDGEQYLERFEDRACMVALTLGAGDPALAAGLLDELLSGRFQVTTPTLLNSGLSRRGESISCFLLRIEDNMESVSRGINAAMQLSRRSGGISFLLTNLRETGAPIKGRPGQAPGVVPIMKVLEDAFTYAHQMGVRQGAGSVYLHAHHPDVLRFLDTKRENADEKVRIKSLSLGLVIPDITFELARRNQEMCLFSPYDVERVHGVPLSDIAVSERYDELVADDRIGKTRINARQFFQTVAELQFESGYPYLMFEDTANRANPIAGRITHSNLCSEILQVSTPSKLRDDLSYEVVGRDISCNLGSLNIAAMMASPDFAGSVETVVRGLTAASENADLACVPTVARGNDAAHAIGLGQMNLHGFLAAERIHYGSPEALEFTSLYFATIAFHAIGASSRLARERGRPFEGFEQSKYANGSYFARYVDRPWQPELPRVRQLFAAYDVRVPDQRDWAALRDRVMRDGMYNQNLQAVAPNGSIAYLNNATASLHPVPAKIEIRKEGRIGRVYFPAPHLSNDNVDYFEDAYEVGHQRLIDTYAAAGQHVDQGLSLTLFFKDTVSTREINQAQIYAWRKGIKTLYYVRLRQIALKGTEVEGHVTTAF